MTNKNSMRRAGIALACSLLALQACSSSDDDNPIVDPVTNPGDGDGSGGDTTPVSYSVSAVNLTNGQPMSPPLLVLHSGDYSIFTVGSPASAGLELLAEGGDNSGMVAELTQATSVITSTAGDGPIGPGGNASYTLSDTGANDSRFISMATMLVNTNDAISGINRADVSALEAGQSIVINSVAYDTGTEANSEAQGTIPGPADGGEGFNAVRDDIADVVNMHSGVVTSSDGLADSILTNDHRFLNPVMRITITRTE